MVYFINYFIFVWIYKPSSRSQPEKAMEITPARTDKRRLFARWFIRRLTTCVVVCAFLAFVNWQTSPHYWWVLWVIAGWGLNIALSLAWYLFDCDDECNYRNR